MNLRRFLLVRDEDVTGVSGLGTVAEGVQFSDGRAVVCWRGERSSTVVWNNIEDAIAVHGHGGKTRFEWIDEDVSYMRHTNLCREELEMYLATLGGYATWITNFFRGFKSDTMPAEMNDFYLHTEPVRSKIDRTIAEIVKKEEERR
jgi:hypothetical protein